MVITLRPQVLGFIVATRAALAFGIGLLVADRIPQPRRRSIAMALITVGVATTIPAASALLRQRTEGRRVTPIR